MTIALIATVKNEADSINAFLASIEKQTRMPDHVVIVDGGSTDGTWEAIYTWDFGDRASLDTFRVRQLGNRSVGRNEAIRIAEKRGANIIACTNVSVLDSDWFERITAPIWVHGEGPKVVGGGYRIVTENDREVIAAAVTQYTSEEAVRKKFVTALSMAFTVEAWKSVGGFPEELDTSEDTVFVQRLRDAAYEFAYVPKAVVNWRPLTLTLRGAYRTYRQFAETDRKAGVKKGQYVSTIYAYTVPLALAMLGFASYGFLVFTIWTLWRSRKMLVIGIPYTVAVDLGRLRGYFFR